MPVLRRFLLPFALALAGLAGPAGAAGWELGGGATRPEARVCAEAGGCFALGCAGTAPLSFRLVLPVLALGAGPQAIALDVDGRPAGALLFSPVEGAPGIWRAPFDAEADAGLIARLRAGNRLAVELPEAPLALSLAGSSARLGEVLATCPAPPARSADPAARVLASIARDCAALGGEVSVEPGFRREEDFDGDGRIDLVIDHAAATCSKRASLSCSTAGCIVSFWQARDAGFENLFTQPIRGYAVEPGGVLALDLDGLACGTIGFEPCRKRYALGPDGPMLVGMLTGDAAIAAMDGGAPGVEAAEAPAADLAAAEGPPAEAPEPPAMAAEAVAPAPAEVPQAAPAPVEAAEPAQTTAEPAPPPPGPAAAVVVRRGGALPLRATPRAGLPLWIGDGGPAGGD